VKILQILRNLPFFVRKWFYQSGFSGKMSDERRLFVIHFFQERFIEGNITAAQILSAWGWVCFTLNFVLFFYIDRLLTKFGIGKSYAVILFLISTMMFIPFSNIWFSGFLQLIISTGQQFTWQLPSIAVAMHCYLSGEDKVSFYNGTLNTMGNFGQIVAGVLNTTLSSMTYLGFGLTFLIAGICAFFAGFLALAIPNGDSPEYFNFALCDQIKTLLS